MSMSELNKVMSRNHGQASRACTVEHKSYLVYSAYLVLIMFHSPLPTTHADHDWRTNWEYH